MSGLCNSVSDFATIFIGLAILIIVIGIVVPLFGRTPQADDKQQPYPTILGVNIGPAFEGLAKVLVALKDLPPWMAIFLAGLALVWTATSAPGLCT